MYGGVPPETFAEALPLLFPKQSMFTMPEKEFANAGGDVSVTVFDKEQPMASVTVMEYVPAESPVAVEVVCADGFHK